MIRVGIELALYLAQFFLLEPDLITYLLEESIDSALIYVLNLWEIFLKVIKGKFVSCFVLLELLLS